MKPTREALRKMLEQIEWESAKQIILAALESEENKLRSEGETDAAYKYAGARMLVENLKP